MSEAKDPATGGSLPREGLAELARAVRESTLVRLRRVPPGRENWRPVPGAMSFADVARHLIETDEWLFRKLRERDLAPIAGEAGAIRVDGPAEWEELLALLERSGRRRVELLDEMEPERLDERIPDARFGGEVSVWWIIVRGNLDHEAHHRGQLAVYLRIVEAQPGGGG